MDFEQIIQKIKASKKYRFLCEDTIRNVLEEEVQHHKTLKKAVDPAKKRLHKIWASYLGEPNYPEVKAALQEAFAQNDEAAVKSCCQDILNTHSSARERMHLLESYYQQIFTITGKPKSIVDLACALHPFSFRWMELPASTNYYATDINQNFVELINFYFQLEGLKPLAQLRDILCNPLDIHCDLAFLFKMYHCLEIRKRGAGMSVLRSVKADWAAVSFPSKNLVGQKAAIIENYRPDIEKAAITEKWDIFELQFENEDLLIIKKNG